MTGALWVLGGLAVVVWGVVRAERRRPLVVEPGARWRTRSVTEVDLFLASKRRAANAWDEGSR